MRDKITPLNAFLASALIVGLIHAKNVRSAEMENAFQAIPSRFTTQDLSLERRSLGEICLSRGVFPDGTICNPAFLDESTENSLLARAFIGNGYSAVKTANQLIFNPLSAEFLRNLFSNQSVTTMEADVTLAFTTKNFSASFTPYRVQYVSEVHNPNYPVISVHASWERNLTLASGTSLETLSPVLAEFSFGTQLRVIERKFVHGAFSLSQALTDSPDNLLPIQQQTSVLLDPTLGWRSKNVPWRPRASLSVFNLGWTSKKSPLYSNLPDIAAGFGLQPPVGPGTLNLGLDIVDLAHGQDLMSRLKLGTSYRYGITEAMLGLNSNAWTGGLDFSFQIFQAGIVYEFQRNELDGGPSENRLATQIVLRL